MNLIIVAKFLKSPKQLRVHDPRVLGTVAAFVLAIGSLGAACGVLFYDATDRTLDEVGDVREQLQTQQAELAAARSQVDRELNAMAARLGELQAQSTRLNALGERLTRVGQLEDGEFDFSEAPALGGPESTEEFGATTSVEIQSSLDELAGRLARQSQQLELLENLMLDRDVEANLLPAGSPVRSGYASSSFGMRSDPFTGHREFHRGIDFNGERNADVLAAADGVVAFAGRHPSYGNMVDIDHGNGYMTRYAHNQQNLVEPGRRVRAGEVIAKMGNTGRATGVHVHFEVWLNDRPVNPFQYLKKAARG